MKIPAQKKRGTRHFKNTARFIKQKWNNALINLILLLTSLAVALFIAEILVRKMDSRDYVQQNIYKRSKTRSYELKPNLVFQGKAGIHSFTNSLGLPEKEVPLSKDPEETRILFLGNSCTHNGDVHYEERFTTLVGRELDKHFKDRKITSINAGITGYNVRQMITLYNEVGKAYDPDIVVLHFLVRATFRRSLINQTFLEMPDYMQKIILSIYDRSALIRKIRETLFSLSTGAAFLEMGDMRNFIKSSAWEEMRDLLLMFKKQLNKENRKFVILLYTYLHSLNELKPYYDEVVKFANDNNIDVITTWDRFKSLEKGGKDLAGLWVSESDSHPNATANGIVADAVVKYFRSRLSY